MSDQNQQRQFSLYLKQMLFGLISVVDNPKDKEHFPLCSGCVLPVQDYLVLITVAHGLRDIEKWKRQGRLAQLGLVIHDNSELGHRIVSLNLDTNPIYIEDDIDVGFIRFSSDVIEQIIEFGGKSLNSENLAASSDGLPDRFILVGHVSSQCKLSHETIASDSSNEWQLERPEALTVIFAALQYDGVGEEPFTCVFTPLKPIDDYVGASGGPVFGYSAHAQMRDYTFYGVQSKQVLAATREQKPKQLVATLASVAVQRIADRLSNI